ncbi:glycosyltransferase family 2 protein [Roseivirga misakiensis]|uniref:Glycosyltransferase 2-like domain-containing protein n=1 Tax=Roseivirga misakiensis TaxID=1563681 RepID=A0A1E5T5V7_9BACT|nr:glycosyltransferase family 2 protein [Roseivirga misakiensis]OEK06771.1 hypothetical protein BFP71_03670 [Roseivirga misakiensis]
MKYSIVSPVKNEELYVEKTILSVVAQTLTPTEWLIVDDGSTDDTLVILRKYEEKYDWIRVISNPSHDEQRAGGSKVMRAFYIGYEALASREIDFIVKLDGDLELPKEYFQTVANTFDQNPKVGICGGYIKNKIGDKLIQEGELDYHVRGAFKSVRMKCFQEIGGFKVIWNWDGLDSMQAMMNGWETKVFDLPVIHYRPTSSAYNPVKFHFKDGRYAYRLRTSFFLAFLRFIGRLKKRPILVPSIFYILGYHYALLSNDKYIIDKELGAFTNKFHTKRILDILFRR